MSHSTGKHVCPAQFAWVIDNALRRWLHRPEAILEGLIAPGSTVLDLGCGSGPFTPTLARMVGASGRVIAADLQPKMLAKVEQRLVRAGLRERVELHVCQSNRIGLEDRIDFVLAFWMVHEVPSAEALFAELRQSSNDQGKLLLVEPKFHVRQKVFDQEVAAAASVGWQLLARPTVRWSNAALLGRSA